MDEERYDPFWEMSPDGRIFVVRSGDLPKVEGSKVWIWIFCNFFFKKYKHRDVTKFCVTLVRCNTIKHNGVFSEWKMIMYIFFGYCLVCVCHKAFGIDMIIPLRNIDLHLWYGAAQWVCVVSE